MFISDDGLVDMREWQAPGWFTVGRLGRELQGNEQERAKRLTLASALLETAATALAYEYREENKIDEYGVWIANPEPGHFRPVIHCDLCWLRYNVDHVFAQFTDFAKRFPLDKEFDVKFFPMELEKAIFRAD